MVNWNSRNAQVGDTVPGKLKIVSVQQQGDNLVYVVELTELPAGLEASKTVTVIVGTPAKAS